MRLKFQLFFILLLASAMLIAALYAFNSWSFNRGFISYINRSQENDLNTLAESLADGYERNGQSWDWVLESPGLWRQISASATRHRLRQRDTPGRDRPAVSRAPEAAADGTRSERAMDSSNRPPRPGPGPGPSPIVLADADKQLLIGRAKNKRELNWLPVISDDETVGFISYARSDRLPGSLDKLFAAQQKKSFALASLLMVVLSALLAALLASRIVAPVTTITRAVGKLRQGDYSQRVPATRRDELGDLSRDVNQLALTLAESRSARQKWIAEISHELRTPVSILQGEIEAIEDGIRPLDASSLASLHTETLRLSRLISDLHDLSLSDLGALNYEMAPIELQQVVQQRLAAAEPARLERQLSIELEVNTANTRVLGDEQRLQQLFDNLLQNSLRYTRSPGTIRIELTQQADALRIDWMDSAPGVSDTDLNNLFDPLFRVEQSRNRAHGGAGLGLAIAKKIVTSHSGTISASPASLGGVLITIELPLVSTRPT